MTDSGNSDVCENSCVSYLFHGGGPLPLMGRSPDTVNSWQPIKSALNSASAIILISAHWEEPNVTVHTGENPNLLFDYYGFPDHTYQYEYKAKGNPELAARCVQLLEEKGLNPATSNSRGWDHGVFVPLINLIPDAHVPVVQISLVQGLDEQTHFQIGEALAPLLEDNVYLLASGASFHNMRVFMSGSTAAKGKSAQWQSQLIEATTSPTQEERYDGLLQKSSLRTFCHPREEHLAPLWVAVGSGINLNPPESFGVVDGKQVMFTSFTWSKN